jgi:hydrogenase maturation factor HypF (carbamoyltransferase family)
MSYFSDELLNSPQAMLSAITQMDEAGARLVANYQKTYPHLIEKIEHARFETNETVSMLIKLWGMAALFIGLCDGDSIQNGCEQLEATALEFNGKSGPRIDYKVIKTALGYEVDPRLAIRSAMSFKLAGVDDYLLSYGFIDSLADFIAQQAELADANIAISGVALGGSLFENRQLLSCTYNVLQANYPIFHNERLSMDGANVAVGAITLGSE